MSDQHQGHTVDDIADRIGQLPGSILDIEETEQAPGDAPSQEDEAAPEAEEDSPPEQKPEEAEAGDEEEKETDTDEKPEAEEEQEEKPDESASEEDEPVYEVTLPDGETQEVPVSELASGYLKAREAETTKAEAAEVRRDYERRVQELPQLVQQATQERENHLAQQIQQWAEMNPIGEPPPAQMLDPNSDDYNPDRYHYEMRQYEERKQKAQQAAQQLQQIAEQREAQRRQHEAQEREKLKAAWPELLEDGAKQEAFIKQANEHFGLSPEEIRGINDHRHFLILRDAIGYREMKAKAPDVRAKAKAPKPKPVKPGPRKTHKDRKQADLTEQRKRLRKTGRPEDAAALLMERGI